MYEVEPKPLLEPADKELIKMFDAEFESKYRDDLQYHPYSHAKDVLLPSLYLVRRAARYDVMIDRPPVIGAALGHDMMADKPLDPAEGFKSKEERAAAEADQSFAKLGFDDIFRSAAKEYILSTGPEYPNKTPGGVVLSMADLYTVAYKGIRFYIASPKLYLERRMLQVERGEEPVKWSQFTFDQQALLRQFFSKKLSLGPFDEDKHGNSLFVQLATPNIDSLSTTPITNPNSFMRTYGKSLELRLPAKMFADFKEQIAA